METGMAHPNYNNVFLLCARDCQNPAIMLHMFQNLTPQNCHFRPTKIWARHTRRKRNPCLWCVLYTSINPQTSYLKGGQGRELRNEVNKLKPINAEIVDYYEFLEDNGTGQCGWVVVWKNLLCNHQPNFHKV